jgi:sugar phosphate isomerase/epimerase
MMPSDTSAVLGANCLPALFLPEYSLPDAHRAALESVRAAGLDAAEISQPGILSLANALALRGHAQRLGLQIAAVHAPPMHRDPALARQRHAATLAAELAAPILVVHVSSLRFASPDLAVRAVTRQRDLRRLEALVSFCAPLGVALGLENGKHPDHVRYLLGLIDELEGSAPERPAASSRDASGCRAVITPSARIGLVFDSGHAALRGGNPLVVAAEMLPRLLHTHLHDNQGARDEHLAPGQGSIDWPALLAVLSQGGYAGPFLSELRPRPDLTVARWQRDLALARSVLSEAHQPPKEER